MPCSLQARWSTKIRWATQVSSPTVRSSGAAAAARRPAAGRLRTGPAPVLASLLPLLPPVRGPPCIMPLLTPAPRPGPLAARRRRAMDDCRAGRGALRDASGEPWAAPGTLSLQRAPEPRVGSAAACRLPAAQCYLPARPAPPRAAPPLPLPRAAPLPFAPPRRSLRETCMVSSWWVLLLHAAAAAAGNACCCCVLAMHAALSCYGSAPPSPARPSLYAAPHAATPDLTLLHCSGSTCPPRTRCASHGRRPPAPAPGLPRPCDGRLCCA